MAGLISALLRFPSGDSGWSWFPGLPSSTYTEVLWWEKEQVGYPLYKMFEYRSVSNLGVWVVGVAA
jgi:hypothetical protein